MGGTDPVMQTAVAPDESLVAEVNRPWWNVE